MFDTKRLLLSILYTTCIFLAAILVCAIVALTVWWLGGPIAAVVIIGSFLFIGMVIETYNSEEILK